MADFPRKERLKTALDNKKLNLSTPCPTAKGKYSSLSWQIVANNPRLVVYTNDPEDTGESKGYGKIQANFGLQEMFGVFEMINGIIAYTGELPHKQCVDNMNFVWFGGKKSQAPELQSQFWCGKDKDGVVWISVTARDRPKIKFNIIPSDFHCYKHGDGTQFTAGEASILHAKGYVRLMEGMLVAAANSNYVEPPPRDPPAGGGGGYGNRGGQGGGGGGGRSNGGGNSGGGADFSDDIPF